MQIRQLSVPLRVARLWRVGSFLAVVAGAAGLPASGISAQAGGPYDINWHVIASGGVVRSRNPCYRLSGTTAQATVTPGITMGTTYTLFSGFWSAAPIANRDQIFFDGFEDCKQ
ncbi:MAG TPA: hypothetical protein PKD77_05875 [Rudaea sp.]|nr:hypothetical protein [Rudaea sp.]